MIPKFRVWDKKEKQLLKIGLINLKDKTVYGAKNNYFKKYYGDIDMQKADSNWGLFNDLIFMQSTGLKDKNGIEVFEGDIVKNINTGSVGRVYWDVHNTGFFYSVKRQGQALFDSYTIFRASYNLEVIGNIYENPELLEVE